MPFKEEVIAGASPISFKPTSEEPRERGKGRPKLETNLVANVPPAEILSKCELLEPLPEDTVSEYQWLISSLRKPSHGIVDRLQCCISSIVQTARSKMQFKAA